MKKLFKTLKTYLKTIRTLKTLDAPGDTARRSGRAWPGTRTTTRRGDSTRPGQGADAPWPRTRWHVRTLGLA